MTVSQRYFMVVAKEKSVAAAAEILYTTPQNLSNHIKRLEQEYGILFTRYPHFKLTDAGEVLLETLKQIAVLEKALSVKLDELRKEEHGHIRIGIHSTRARILLPSVMKEFRKHFPYVFVEFFYQGMPENVDMLLRGDIDLCFGLDPQYHSELSYIAVDDDPIFCVVSSSLLKQERIVPHDNTLRAKDLEKLPFLLSPDSSNIRTAIDTYCDRKEVILPKSTIISDFELQMILAAENMGACFCPKMLLQKMKEINSSIVPENQLTAFRVEGLSETSKLYVVLHKAAYRSKALRCLVDSIRRYFPLE